MTVAALLLRSIHVVCPITDRDGRYDVRIVNGRYAEINPSHMDQGDAGSEPFQIDGRHLTMIPGLVDLNAHLCEPGQEHKGTIESAQRAAARAGFTLLCASPASAPVNDSRAVTEFILRRCEGGPGARVRPVAALTVGLKGRRLTEMFELKEAGAIAFSQGTASLESGALARRALEYAHATGMPVLETPLDLDLAGVGVMHEGVVSTRLGLPGIPSAAEEAAVARAIILAELTGACLHLGPLSCAASVDALARAKARGIRVSGSVSIGHLHLTADDVAKEWSSHLRTEPPYRCESDRLRLLSGVVDGTIDALSAVDRPQSRVEKAVPFGRAAPGALGFESAIGLGLRLVGSGQLSLSRFVSAFSVEPRRIIGAPLNPIAVGERADLTIFDPAICEVPTFVDRAGLAENSAFAQDELPGKIMLTMVDGKVAYMSAEAKGWNT